MGGDLGGRGRGRGRGLAMSATPQRRREDYAIPLRAVAQGAVACWAIVATLASIGLWIQNDTSEKALARASGAVNRSNGAADRAEIALRNVTSTRALAQAIQAERRQTILRDCQETNARHDATIRQLDQLIATSVRHAKTGGGSRIKQSRAPTTLLINALAPTQNCGQLIHRDFSTGK